MKHIAILLVCCFILMAPLRASDELYSSVESVFYQCRAALERIGSIQFESECKYELSDSMERQKGTYKNKFGAKSTFYEQGGKFRSEAFFDDWSSEKSHNMYSLYNGEKYQIFYPGSGALTHSSKCRVNNSSVVQNPILMPYIFLMPDDNSFALSLDNLRNANTWQNVANKSVFKGLQKLDGYDCAVIDVAISALNRKGFQRVYFATDLSCLPMQIETWVDDKMIGKLTVKELKKFSSPEGTVAVPTAIQVIDRDERDRELLRTTILLDIETLKVNEPIDETLFEIPITEATVFIDADLGIPFMVNAPVTPMDEIASESANGGREHNTLPNHTSRPVNSQDFRSNSNESVTVSGELQKELPGNRGRNNTYSVILLLVIIFLCLLAGGAIITKRRKRNA